MLGERYRLDRRLGRGGMSVVWAGYDTVLDREIAIKVLASAAIVNPTYRRSIVNEAKAAASLSHPHVASVFDFGEYDDESGERVPFVVMELLRGQSLAERLKQGPLEPQTAMRICAQVAGGLAAAHNLGIVHRDIKPGNVMLTRGGAKVFDFGIAASIGQFDDPSAGSPILGTAAYLAPERLAGGPVTAASDVYGLALLLYRALTNDLPWSVETITDMIAAHAYAEPSPLPALDGLPQTVRDLVLRCLSKEPEDRPSARAAAIVLAAAAGIAPPLGEDAAEAGAAAPPPIRMPLMVAPSEPRGRRGLIAAIAIAASVLGLAVLIPLASGWGGPEPDGGVGIPTAVVTSIPVTSPTTTLSPAAGVGGVTPSPTGAPTTTQPNGNPPPPPPPPPDPDGLQTVPITSPPTNETVTELSSPGGTVRVTCRPEGAYLLNGRPAPGFDGRLPDGRGPLPTLKVRFRSTTIEYMMRVKCVGGTPTGQYASQPVSP